MYWIDTLKEKEILGLNFKIGQIEKNKVVVVKCGVGKVNAARVAQILIDKLDVKYMINVGASTDIEMDLERMEKIEQGILKLS